MKQINNMGVHSIYQDLADRYYKNIKGERVFQRLASLAKKHGTQKVEWAIGECKELGKLHIDYLTKVLKK